MDQRQMNWCQTMPNNQTQMRNSICGLANLADAPSSNNRMNMNFSMNQMGMRPPPAYTQIQHPENHPIVKLFSEARMEQIHPRFCDANNPFEKRRNLQMFLMKSCNDRTIYAQISDTSFATYLFKHPNLYFIIEQITGISQKNILQMAETFTKRQRTVKPAMNQGQMYRDTQHGQAHTNYSQFQVNDRNYLQTNGNVNSYSASQPNIPNSSTFTPYSQGQVVQSRGWDRQLSPVIQNNQPLPQASAPAVQTNQSRWFSMPTETYDEAGRVVTMQGGQQRAPQKIMPRSESLNSSAHPPQVSYTQNVPDIAMRQSTLPQSASNHDSSRSNLRMSSNDNSNKISNPTENQNCNMGRFKLPLSQPQTAGPLNKKVKTYPPQSENRTISPERSLPNVRDTGYEEQSTCSLNQTKSGEPRDSKQKLREMMASASKSKHSSDDIAPTTEFYTSVSDQLTSNADVTERDSSADPNGDSVESPSTKSIQEPNYHRSTGEYDPPLPVIRHKKREERTPLKGSPKVNSDQSSPKDNVEDSREDEREPLFSLFDNYVMPVENNEQSSAVNSKEMNSNTQKESSPQPVSAPEESMKHGKKRRHTSAEVSSTGSPRNEPNSEVANQDRTLLKNACKKNLNKDASSDHNNSQTVSAREKVYSSWCNKLNSEEEKQKHISKHNRRSSCPEDRSATNQPGKPSRSNTLDPNTGLSKSTKECSHKSSSSKSGFEETFVWIHGEKLLKLNVHNGQFLVMKELLVSLFSQYESTRVYKQKTSELGIRHKSLHHACKNDVVKYLDSKGIKCSSQMGIIELFDAQRLVHHVQGIKECHESCISSQANAFCPPVSANGKGRSESPDSTMNTDKRSQTKASRTDSEGTKNVNDLQQNKVSSQSLDSSEETEMHDDDDDDAASNISDATDVYCDGKPLPLDTVSTKGGGCSLGDGEGGGSAAGRLSIDFDGGLAVVRNDEMDDRYVRFVNIRGTKCYLYQDLFRLFGRNEVVKIVINNSMHLKTCTQDEADYMNRQKDMEAVNLSDSFLQEKYALKVFAYMGESFPKLKLPINAELDKFKSPTKATSLHGDSDGEPPTKKAKRDDTLSDKDASDHDESEGKHKGNEDNTDTAMDPYSELKTQHMQLEAQFASLKEDLAKMRNSNLALERRCKNHEDDVASVRHELEVICKEKAELEVTSTTQIERIAMLTSEVIAKDNEKEAIVKERDHFKGFVDNVMRTYSLDEDSEEQEMKVCDGQINKHFQGMA